MSEKNARRKAKEEVSVRETGLGNFQLHKTIRDMIWRRLRFPYDGAAGWPDHMTPMAQWLFQEANSSELRAVAKAIKKNEKTKWKGGVVDSRLAEESYLEVRAARARMRDKRPTLLEVRVQVLRNCMKHRVTFGEGQEFERIFSSSKDSQQFNLFDRLLRKKLDSLNCPLRPKKRGRPVGS